MFDDWNHYIGLDEWCLLASRNFPDWERDNNKQLYSVIISFRKGISHSSVDIAREIDDLITNDFYYKNYTELGNPFIREGEIYTAKFWFKKQIDFYIFQLFLKEKDFITTTLNI